MQILKIKCCRKDSLLDKLCDYLKTYHIPHIAFVDGNCFAIYVDDKDFNLEQINGFEFEYESDVYIKDGKTYLDTGISHKLLKIKKHLEEGLNMINGYQPKDCIKKPCPPTTSSKVGTVAKLKVENLWRYSINEGEFGGIVIADSIGEARKKVKEKYEVKSIIEVWAAKSDDYYDEHNKDVIECYGM